MKHTELWQEVNCHQHDYDIQGDDMVFIGMEFNCLACDGEHVATVELISTFVATDGEVICLENPKTLEQLNKLRSKE